MNLPKVSISFVWVVLACGLLSLLALFWNIGFFGRHRHPVESYKRLSQHEVSRGRDKIIEYGCGGCHIIPGVPGAVGRVGPNLANIREQMFIAGHLKNSTEEMVLWIQRPHVASPNTAMPDLGVSEEDAKSITAYLYQKTQ